jgi:hypothetical protein
VTDDEREARLRAFKATYEAELKRLLAEEGIDLATAREYLVLPSEQVADSDGQASEGQASEAVDE